MDIRKELEKRILIIDGAMGTMIQRHKPTEATYRGERFKDWSLDVKNNSDIFLKNIITLFIYKIQFVVLWFYTISITGLYPVTIIEDENARWFTQMK